MDIKQKIIQEDFLRQSVEVLLFYSQKQKQRAEKGGIHNG